MSEFPDMDAPVTRREMYEALETWGGAFERRLLDAMKAMFDAIERRFTAFEQRFTAFDLRFDAFEKRMHGEIKQLTKGSEQELAARLVAVDEQYRDLPPRVSKLEAKVFAPKRRRSVKARRRR